MGTLISSISMKYTKFINIFLVVFVDLLGFGLILPLLPYYAETFGATAGLVGLLVGSYAAAQLIGAPILGRLSDRIGRRPVLLMSVAGTVAGFVLLGFSAQIGQSLAGIFKSNAINSFVIGVLFFSRILDGLTGGNLTVAQAYITDLSDEQNRAKSLGLIGAAFGLGFIIGPAVGGTLSKWGYNMPALVAAGLSLVNLVSIYFFLPESLTGERKDAAMRRRRAPFSFNTMIKAFRRPQVGPLLQVRFFYGLAFAIFQSIFALFTQSLGISSQTTGFILTFVGVIAVVVQGGLIGVLTRRFRDNWLIINGLWLMSAALLAWGFTSNLWILLLVILPIASAGGVLNTVTQSAITKMVVPEEVGGILGITTSLEAVTRVIAPSLGGFLLQNLGIWAPGVCAALLLLLTVGLTYRQIILPARRNQVQTVRCPEN
jgi:DHA1 family tetracycline resistance protein-like MFS transporter